VRSAGNLSDVATVSDATIRTADEISTGVASLLHLDGQFGNWADSKVGLPGW